MTAEPAWPRVLLRSEDSHHHLSVIETAPAPGVGPPLHSHDFDETFYVVEGELIFGSVMSTSQYARGSWPSHRAAYRTPTPT